MNATATHIPTKTRIALVGPSKADPDYAMTVAALRADDAHWAGDYEAEARWSAVARAELAKLYRLASAS